MIESNENPEDIDRLLADARGALQAFEDGVGPGRLLLRLRTASPAHPVLLARVMFAGLGILCMVGAVVVLVIAQLDNDLTRTIARFENVLPVPEGIPAIPAILAGLALLWAFCWVMATFAAMGLGRDTQMLPWEQQQHQKLVNEVTRLTTQKAVMERIRSTPAGARPRIATPTPTMRATGSSALSRSASNYSRTPGDQPSYLATETPAQGGNAYSGGGSGYGGGGSGYGYGAGGAASGGAGGSAFSRTPAMGGGFDRTPAGGFNRTPGAGGFSRTPGGFSGAGGFGSAGFGQSNDGPRTPAGYTMPADPGAPPAPPSGFERPDAPSDFGGPAGDAGFGGIGANDATPPNAPRREGGFGGFGGAPKGGFGASGGAFGERGGGFGSDDRFEPYDDDDDSEETEDDRIVSGGGVRLGGVRLGGSKPPEAVPAPPPELDVADIVETAPQGPPPNGILSKARSGGIGARATPYGSAGRVRVGPKKGPRPSGPGPLGRSTRGGTPLGAAPRATAPGAGNPLSFPGTPDRGKERIATPGTRFGTPPPLSRASAPPASDPVDDEVVVMEDDAPTPHEFGSAPADIHRNQPTWGRIDDPWLQDAVDKAEALVAGYPVQAYLEYSQEPNLPFTLVIARATPAMAVRAMVSFVEFLASIYTPPRARIELVNIAHLDRSFDRNVQSALEPYFGANFEVEPEPGRVDIQFTDPDPSWAAYPKLPIL